MRCPRCRAFPHCRTPRLDPVTSLVANAEFSPQLPEAALESSSVQDGDAAVRNIEAGLNQAHSEVWVRYAATIRHQPADDGLSSEPTLTGASSVTCYLRRFAGARLPSAADLKAAHPAGSVARTGVTSWKRSLRSKWSAGRSADAKLSTETRLE